MSSKPKRNETKELHATPGQKAEAGQTSSGSSARDKKIRRREYEIYLERGGQPGRELDDWLRADSELQGGGLAQAS